MKKYYTYTVKKIITVQHLVTIEYLPVTRGFFYPEETHDFYEFVYVESGQITCNTASGSLRLKENSFFLISPGTPHAYSADSSQSATVLIVCFKSKSNMIAPIKGVHYLDGNMKLLVRNILSEAKETFVFPFDEKLTLSQSPRLGSQQLIENYIEELLIRLVQAVTYKQENVQIVPSNSHIKHSLTEEIKQILSQNLYRRITLSDISSHTLYSKTYLNDIFKELTGCTIMQYYQNLKIEEAKLLLDRRESIASVSEKLCFESPQYFAKAFKKKTGQTPTEYKKRPVF